MNSFTLEKVAIRSFWPFPPLPSQPLFGSQPFLNGPAREIKLYFSLGCLFPLLQLFPIPLRERSLLPRSVICAGQVEC